MERKIIGIIGRIDISTLLTSSCTKLVKVEFHIKSCHCSIAVLFDCYYSFLLRKNSFNHETMVVALPRSLIAKS